MVHFVIISFCHRSKGFSLSVETQQHTHKIVTMTVLASLTAVDCVSHKEYNNHFCICHWVLSPVQGMCIVSWVKVMYDCFWNHALKLVKQTKYEWTNKWQIFIWIIAIEWHVKKKKKKAACEKTISGKRKSDTGEIREDCVPTPSTLLAL